MERLKLQTTDMAERNVELLGQMFPNCLTETINSDGKLVRAIDFDKLRQELACEVVEGADERYQFTWPDKRAAIRLANAPTNKTLRPCREESVDFDNTENLYIEGDNLEVLKLLRENYLGKVKMIYIDPPYNTGNDFVYNDAFGMSNDEFKPQSGLFDEEGNRMADPMVQNTESNGRFHTDWLNMIYPRLKVAKDLLSDDGSIFITLDDHEYSNAKKICDEIFGESDFIATIIWENFYGRSNAAAISPSHNYILVYSRAGENWKNIRNLLERNEKSISNYKNPDNDPKGPWRLGPIFASGERHQGLMYTIKTPNGDLITPPKGSHWRMLEDDFWKRVEEGSIVFGMDGKGSPATKLYLSDVQSGLVPRSLWLHDEAGHTQDGKREVMSLFPEASVFDTPKPTKLIRQIVKIACCDNDTILDFFSGSATTAHAVMQLNAEDEGSRRFIMVQLPELTDEKSDAYKAGYKNICEIGKERIRRAGKKIKEDNANKAGIERLDTGFRVLKLDTSNMADVYYTPADTPIQTTLNFDALVDNIREGRTAEDLLFQVLPECNLPLSSKIEIREIHGKKVFVVEDGYLMACFDSDINDAVITAIAKEKPYYFVMCDRSIASDSVADNFDQIFEAYSRETVRRIL
ncbi:MAG: site-specific DNA-methyltransferase [Bacteroidales bacterium]|nr:site-specific DNA-methyltransferase [Bacteroidales bacterium]